MVERSMARAGVAGLTGGRGRARVGDELHPLAGVALGVDVGDVLAGDLERLALRIERRQRDPQAVEIRQGNRSQGLVDQEMATLLQLQNSYAANARIMSALRDMIEALMRI